MEDADDSDPESQDGGKSGASSSGSSKAIMQMAPLELRFSQRKMRSIFADGREIADTVDLVRAVKRDLEEAEIYGAEYRLEAPFPAVEVIRWRCKLRDENTGRPLVDARGKEMFEPEENWFTLDNRRLYCLQRAALKLLPARCTADAIAEIRKDRRMREIRKFRTLDNGISIQVGSVVDGVPFVRWSWPEELQRMRGKGKGKGGGKGDQKGGKGHAKGGKGEDGKAHGGKGGVGGYADGGAYGGKGGGKHDKGGYQHYKGGGKGGYPFPGGDGYSEGSKGFKGGPIGAEGGGGGKGSGKKGRGPGKGSKGDGKEGGSKGSGKGPKGGGKEYAEG